MKNLTSTLKESIINEADTAWKLAEPGDTSSAIDDVDYNYKGDKKIGFLSWLPDDKMMCMTAADSVEDYVNEYDMDDDATEALNKLNVGEVWNNDGVLTMRIW